MIPGSIVIVDDDVNTAELLGFVFRREGFATVLLRDGRAAEHYVAAHEPPSAVVLDVMLPYRDGFEVAATIRSDGRWKAVPIVMLTARSLDADVERGRSLGVADYLMKPFQPRLLVSRIRTVLGLPPERGE